MSRRFALATVIVVSVAVLAGGGPGRALTERPADAGVDGEHIFAGVSYNGQSTYESCRWAVPETTYRLGVRAGLTTREWNGTTWHLYICERDEESSLVWVPDISVEEVIESSHQMVRQQVPTLDWSISPAPERAVVLLPVWFWVPDVLWRPVSVTASVPTPRGAVTVTTTATPSSLRFEPGDSVGEAVECDGPGLAWSPLLPSFTQSECSYEYTRPSSLRSDDRFRARVEVIWQVRWRSNLGGTGRLPDMRTGRGVSLRVRELQAVAVR